ncbi:hypothetical protein TELCIR_19449, partial [Teladorsagia circumcincta]
MSGPAARTPLPIGIQRIKSDPDMDISSLFSNRFAYEQEAYEMGYTMERVASVEQLASALRRYLFAAVHWIEALFSLAQIENVPEKVAVLKSVFAPYTILCQAARTAQNALFQLIRENSSVLHNVTSRFGNILLLLPPLAKLSSLVGENVQFARMFGGSLDPLLVELFADNTSEVIPSPSTREKADVSTQTYPSTSPALPSDLAEVHDEVPACTEPTRPAPVLPT